MIIDLHTIILDPRGVRMGGAAIEPGCRQAIDLDRDVSLVARIVQFGQGAAKACSAIPIGALQLIALDLRGNFQAALGQMIIDPGNCLAGDESKGGRRHERASVRKHGRMWHHKGYVIKP